MQNSIRGVCLSLLLSAAGIVSEGPPARPVDPAEAELIRCNEDALRLGQAMEFVRAAAAYQKCYDRAEALGSKLRAARALAGLGTARSRLFQNREAVDAFQKARKLALEQGDRETATVIALNLASLYMRQGALEEAARLLEEALAAQGTSGPSRIRQNLMVQRSALHAREGRIDQAVKGYREAIFEADRSGDSTAQALGWDHLGYHLLKHKRLEQADAALTEAFRLRRINRDRSLDLTYRNLGMLRLAQGDAASAHLLLGLAIEAARVTVGRAPIYSLYHRRAQAAIALGLREEALRDLETTIHFLREWRLTVLPADSFRIMAGVGAQEMYDRGTEEMYDSFLEVALDLYAGGRRPELAVRALEAVEENRAGAFRETMHTSAATRRQLPPQYWEVLIRLQNAELAVFRRDTPAARTRLAQLRSQRTAMEVGAGLKAVEGGQGAMPGRPVSVASLQQALQRSEALLSFHLRPKGAYLWAVTREAVTLHRLGGLGELEGLTGRFTQAVQDNSPEAVPLGEKLYRSLFGELKPAVISKPRWLLAVDDALFRLPFAALIAASNRDGTPVRLVERNRLQIIPAAVMLTERGAPGWEGPLLGVADPIYNAADPRLPAGSRAGTGTFPLTLPRMPGTAREMAACARNWGAPPSGTVLLSGEHASLRGVEENLRRRRPSIVHFATHLTPSFQQPRESMLILSRHADGRADVLGTTAIAALSAPAALVVMSGCSSGKGEALRGEGLMGLTRAWMAAGAHNVAGTFWPTPDDSGELWQAFYKHLRVIRQQGGPVEPDRALRLAQVEMLHSASWRARPNYWAAYFLVGQS